jgi:methionyl-tRNA formyltransferase
MLDFHFWGTQGHFSRVVLEELLRAGLRPKAVFVPGTALDDPDLIVPLPPPASQSALPLLTAHLQRGTLQVAWEHGLPAYAIHNLRHESLPSQLAELAPDQVLVACFPYRIPDTLLRVPDKGFLNLHPSLLPDLRGPVPLFWTLRLGMADTGATLHRMDAGFDTGNILAQHPVRLPDGIGGPEANRLMARAAAHLFINSQSLLDAPGLPQAAGGRYFGQPGPEDFQLPTTWSARRAYNFMRGTAHWRRPYLIDPGTKPIHARSALSYEPSGRLEAPVQLLEDGRLIQFTPGILRVEAAQ